MNDINDSIRVAEKTRCRKHAKDAKCPRRTVDLAPITRLGRGVRRHADTTRRPMPPKGVVLNHHPCTYVQINEGKGGWENRKTLNLRNGDRHAKYS